MFTIIISLYIIFQLSLSSSSRRLLQTGTGSMTGYWQQDCGILQPDFTCQFAGQVVSDAGTGKVECNRAFGCCLCSQVMCGYTSGQPCDGLSANGPSALNGVKQIAVQGEPGSGAVISCGDVKSCANTHMIGTFIDNINCGGYRACKNTLMEFEQSNGIICSTESCVDSVITLNSNLGGEIVCNGKLACAGANFAVNGNIQDIKCGGIQACKNTVITLTDPMEGFQLTCGGRNSCENLQIDIIIPGPAGGCGAGNMMGDMFEWKGISCGALNSCKDLKLNVINNGCRPIRLEDFSCQARSSCTGSIFDFTQGISPYEVYLQNCHCGPSCQFSTGIDKCFSNTQIIECLEPFSCSQQTQTVHNVANGFTLICATGYSCSGYNLNIDISGHSQNLVQRFTGFICDAPGSCENLLIQINNIQTDSNNEIVPIVIDTIICTMSNSCHNAIFVIGDHVIIDSILCLSPDSCIGCLIKQNVNDLTGTPCYQPSITDVIIGSGTNTNTNTNPFPMPNGPEIVVIPPVISPVIPSVPVIPVIPIFPSNPTTTSVPVIPVVPIIPGIPVIPAIPEIPAIPVVPAIPEIPAIIPSNPAATSVPVEIRSTTPQTTVPQTGVIMMGPADIPQTGGVPAPPILPPMIPVVDPVIPVVDPVILVVDPVIPVVEPVIPVVQTPTQTNTIPPLSPQIPIPPLPQNIPIPPIPSMSQFV